MRYTAERCNESIRDWLKFLQRGEHGAERPKMHATAERWYEELVNVFHALQ